jgi:YVTN family beta-propeller protein
MLLACAAAYAGAGTYRSPYAAIVSSDNKTAYVSDRTADCVVVLDIAEGAKKAEWRVAGGPAGLALSPDGKTLFVALQGSNELAALATDGGKETKRIRVGYRPTGLALAPKSNRLFVCNMGDSTVSVVDLPDLAEKFRVKTVREPMFAAVTPDEARVVVANSLALGPATESTTSASVSIFDAKEGKTGSTVKLPGGSTNGRMVAVSPDGKWAYLVHGVSRFQVPTTQLERGWMNTSALSVIDLTANELYATVLLDSIDFGAPDPYGLALSADGKQLWVSLSGSHEVAKIDIVRLVEMLGGKVPDPYAKSLGAANINPWAEVKKDPKYRFQLVNDLMAMYFGELIERFPSTGKRLLTDLYNQPVEGKGPRCIALSPDGTRLVVPNYFGGTVSILDTATAKLVKTVPAGIQPEMDVVRKGELAFHDADLCFQKWQSCATCHPNNARMDGLRWDLLNDGMGNHKKTRSLLFSYKTAPVMAMGVRSQAEVATRAGFKFILFAVVPEETSAAIDEYLKALQADPNPNRTPDGKLTEAAERGKKLFEGKANCAGCHAGPYYTDMKPYDVGTLGAYDRKDDKFFTPKLTELYRSAPYVHDGRAATLKEVLTVCNKEDKHGTTSKLSEQELDDLIAYLNSL